MALVRSACSGCSRAAKSEDKFCNACGKPIEHKQELPYVGVSPLAGVYRITLIAEQVFRSLDHAEEAAGKSCLYEDGDFKTRKVEFVKTSCGPKTHPFVCTYCRDEDQHDYTRKNPTVSHTDQGRCESCGFQQWEKRH